MADSLPRIRLMRYALCLSAGRRYASTRACQDARSDLVLGEPRLQVPDPLGQLSCARAGAFVDRMIAPAVRPAAVRERVLPARHVGLELGAGLRELGPEAFGHGTY